MILEYRRFHAGGHVTVAPDSGGAHGWIQERQLSWLGSVVRRCSGRLLIAAVTVVMLLLGYGDGLSPFA